MIPVHTRPVVSRPHPRGDRALFAAFLLSGGVVGAYEILWFRALELVLGASAPAVMAVLSGYMSGLGVGSFIAARISEAGGRSPAKALGLLHLLLLGSTALLLAAVRVLAFPPGTPLLAQWLTGIALIVPTGALAGATFPFAVALLRDGDALGRGIVRLYGANILGGVLGMAAVSFAGLEFLGRRGCALVAAAAAFALAAWFFRRHFSRGVPAATAGLVAPPWAAPAHRGGTPTATAFVLGCLGLGMETAVTRLLTPVMGVSVYGLAATVMPFVAGLGLGALLQGTPAFRRLPAPFTLCAAASSLFWGGAALALPRIPGSIVWLASLAPGGEVPWGALLASQVLAATIVVLPAAVCTGTLFAVLLCRGGGAERDAAAVSGRLSGANALGAAFGPPAFNLLLVPLCGVHDSFRVLAGGYLVLGVLALLPRRRDRVGPAVAATVAAALLLALARPSDPLELHAGVYWSARRYAPLLAGPGDSLRAAGGGDREVLQVIEGPTASVLVARSGRQVFLTVDGKPASNTLLDSATQRALARLPLGFVPRPEKALVIGWGSGQTAAELLSSPVGKVTAVEISPEVVEAAPWFAAVNARALSDPRLSVVLDDARHFLATTDERFDIIVSQPSNPWVGVSGLLFTREFFDLCRRRLREGGVLVQWFQTYGAGPEDATLFLSTFAAVFPEWSAWSPQAGDLLVASRAERAGEPSAPVMVEGVPRVRLARRILPPPARELNTDDRPTLSFRLARQVLEHRLPPDLFEPATGE